MQLGGDVEERFLERDSERLVGREPLGYTFNLETRQPGLIQPEL